MERILKPAVSSVLGWLGISDLLWGKKTIGATKFILFIVAVFLYNENFVLNIITWTIFTALWGHSVYTLWQLFVSKKNGEEKQNNIAIPFLGITAFMAIVGLTLIVESVSDCFIADSDKEYTTVDIASMDNFDAIDGTKFTIHGIVKTIDGTTVTLQSGENLSYTMEFFASDQEKLNTHFKNGSQISAYCVGRGVTDNEFSAEKCILK